MTAAPAAFLLIVGLFLIAAPAVHAESTEAPARAAFAELGAGLGVRSWKTAYRTSDVVFAPSLLGAWMPGPWFQLVGAVDHSWRRSRSDGLRIANTETWLTALGRLVLWVDFVRLFAELGPALAWRTARYPDADVRSPLRLSPALNAGAGFSIAIADRLAFTLRGDWRRRNDQAHVYFALDVTWLFRPSTLPR